ncbi:MAG: hypothetical protein GQE15_08720 [Archangiaceae bacterium]|nr:hypothetical protein [Archangiaceae bacterium]
MRISSFIVLLGAATACEQAAPLPATPPQAPPPPPPVAAVVDAGATVAAAVLVEPADGALTQGLPDDPTFNPDDLRDAALQGLLLRDPDRAIRSLEQAPTPSGFQVAVLAALAVRRHIEGPPTQVKETPIPSIPASGTLASAEGPAFVGVQQLEVRSAPGKGKVLATLPTGTPVTIEKLLAPNATISAQLATRVDFGPEGDEPTNVVMTKVTGVVPLDTLVTSRPDAKALAIEATNQTDSDEGNDRALVLWHRAFQLGPTEALRAEMLKAAWKARRPSWVASTALEPIWAAPKSLRVAWACKGSLAKAKWVAPSAKPPADVCLTGVDLRAACGGDVPPAITKRRELLAGLSLSEPAPVAEVVIDGARARRLWAVSLPIKPTNECDLEVEEHKLDIFGAVVRRLPLPLGTTSMVVSYPVVGWHGVEHAVVGAQSETKARDWLRSRSRSKWTYDARGEPAPSLSVGDTSFRLERDVASASVGRLPLMNCDVCGGGEFR